jgi:hypothetical protein
MNLSHLYSNVLLYIQYVDNISISLNQKFFKISTPMRVLKIKSVNAPIAAKNMSSTSTFKIQNNTFIIYIYSFLVDELIVEVNKLTSRRVDKLIVEVNKLTI